MPYSKNKGDKMENRAENGEKHTEKNLAHFT